MERVWERDKLAACPRGSSHGSVSQGQGHLVVLVFETLPCIKPRHSEEHVDDMAVRLWTPGIPGGARNLQKRRAPSM